MRGLIYSLVSFVVMAAGPSSAFCGLYVSRADGDLYNEASKVVMVRDGNQTVITMAADYQGEPSEFAMVVPTPGVLARDQIRTVKAEILAAIDAYSAPRLVEYEDDDPCQPMVEMPAEPAAMGRLFDRAAEPQRHRGPAAFGVNVEAEYTVGEYDIVMLGATQSDGLVQYLLQEGYNIPDGAETVLGDYINGGMKFFVARINLDRHDGASNLTPLQLSFTSKAFMLPIRLGQVNAKGHQDLLLMTLSKKGRVHTQNYPLHRVHTDQEIPIFVRQRFGEFYKAMFDRTVGTIGGSGILMEYAWDMAWCDPCAADPLSNEQLSELGVGWLNEDANAGQDVFVTRFHARYDDSFKEDIVLVETQNRENFQGRYVMREPFEGAFTCDASDYVDRVKARTVEEADTVERLTGWPRRRINEEITRSVPAAYR